MKSKNLLLLILFILLSYSPIYSYKVLFDWTKDETAGNADWVVDRDYPNPRPENPQNERDWDGAFSAFGFAIYEMLHDTVYILHNAPITYHDPENPMDLSNFDVFIVPEPQNPFNENEKDAIKRFLQDGGGLLMIADHNMSDRNRSGWDSPRVFNDLGSEQLFGIHFNITGDRPNSFTEVSRNIPDRTHVIIEGPYGSVNALSFHAGDGMELHPEYNPNVKGLIFKSGYSRTSGVMFAISTYGRGRVAAIGDSSPIDDGTGDPHDRLYDGWNEDGTTHPALMLNAVYWLEQRDAGAENPVFVLDGALDSVATLNTQNGNTLIYTGKNDTVLYVGIKFDSRVARTYAVLSFCPGAETSTPWARDGFLPAYNFYFKIINSTNEVELRDSLQLPAEPGFIKFASSRGFLEFTISRTANVPENIYLLIAGFSTDGGGKIVYATPTIEPGAGERRYSYLYLNFSNSKTKKHDGIKVIFSHAAHPNTPHIYYDLLGRKIPGGSVFTRSGIYFDRKNKKAVIILK